MSSDLVGGADEEVMKLDELAAQEAAAAVASAAAAMAPEKAQAEQKRAKERVGRGADDGAQLTCSSSSSPRRATAMTGGVLVVAARVVIRHAELCDADAIAEVNAAAWKAAFVGVVSQEYLAGYDGAPQRRRDDLIAAPPDAVQLVADDGRVVGWSMGHPCGDDDCDPGTVYEIRSCYVAPTHWRCGLGRHMLQHLLGSLDSRRWREVVLWTPRDTAPTRAFYESWGFQPDGRTAVLDRLGPVPVVRLRRSLPEATPTS